MVSGKQLAVVPFYGMFVDVWLARRQVDYTSNFDEIKVECCFKKVWRMLNILSNKSRSSNLVRVKARRPGSGQ